MIGKTRGIVGVDNGDTKRTQADRRNAVTREKAHMSASSLRPPHLGIRDPRSCKATMVTQVLIARCPRLDVPSMAQQSCAPRRQRLELAGRAVVLTQPHPTHAWPWESIAIHWIISQKRRLSTGP